ncbi:MAG TPA: 5-(carboxyamino)imidazole ribonucleotide synthase [Thermodesulfobacteriota bacterium]|nr:5-(carboxyamino)imidazole ribonucleotide synthase [Thermodesulfobacteriota bacterium]
MEPNRTGSITIGILGGGQLARMTATAAYKLGLRIAILDPEYDSPAQQVANLNVVGPLNDVSATENLARLSNLITLENEFVDAHILEHLESLGVPVYPTAYTVGLIQDKLLQKRALESHGIPVPPFAGVSSHDDVLQAGERFGWPLILKTRRNGYDGRGNAFIRGPEDIRSAWEKLEGERRPLLVEGFIEFKKELAVMVVCNLDGETVTYPVVETIQRDHICHIVKAPAEVTSNISKEAGAIAREAVSAVGGIGAFGVEMFLLADGRVLINELAPRPHNSGHYTIEACVTSQFENHLRAIMGLPLGSPSMVKPSAVMINLLGDRDGISTVRGMERALRIPGVNLHIYGKRLCRPNRKMGHITVLADSTDEALEKAFKAASLISF